MPLRWTTGPSPKTRKSEDEEADHVEDGGDSESEVAPPPPPPAAPTARKAGLYGYNVAISSRSLCVLCKQTIPEGSFRVCYLMSPHGGFKKDRYIHAHCCWLLPAHHREASTRAMQDLSFRPELPNADYQLLDSILEQLTPSAAAASPGSAAGAAAGSGSAAGPWRTEAWRAARAASGAYRRKLTAFRVRLHACVDKTKMPPLPTMQGPIRRGAGEVPGDVC